LLTIHHR